MQKLQKIYRKEKPFYISMFLWLFLLSIISFCIPKLDSFIFINSHNSPLADLFFSSITHLGDGFFIMALAVVLYYFKRKVLGLSIVSTYVISGILCSSLKRVFSVSRPASFLYDHPEFHHVDWMPLAYHNSFPSGHTTSVFALLMTFALFSENKVFMRISLVIACLVAYSRVYLGQHFVDDLWFGTFLGCAVSLVCYRAYEEWLLRKGAFFKIQVPTLNM